MSRFFKMGAVAGFVAVAASASGEESMSVITEIETPFVATYLVKAKTGMSYEAFRAHQVETHVPLALALPGLLDYRLTFFEPTEEGPQPFDAMAQVTFADGAAHAAALASPEGQAALADLQAYLDLEALRVVVTGPGDVIAGAVAAE